MKTCRVVLTALIVVSTLSSCNTKRGQEDESALLKNSPGNAELDQEAIRLIKEAEYTVGKLNNGKEVRAGDMVNTVFFPPK